ncbi:S9 family peptidase, partial [Streptomyces sp. T21Q-yed]|uniref:S9 family peptidase n=1 Tax=Streptomyces sp. T21Q-yed TaxID=3018441 RepID=UPI0023DFA5CC
MRTLAYGSWPSPIDAALAATHDGHPEYVGFVGDEPWWTEPRPTEGGRRTLVRRRNEEVGREAPPWKGGGGRRAGGREESVLPAPWNVRSRVVEYGGRPWAGAVVDGRPLVVFVHFADQRLYRYEEGGEPVPLTPVSAVGGGLRWVEPQLRLGRGEVWCVLEEFTGEGPTDVRRVLAAVPLDGSAAENRDAVRELTDDRRRFVTGARISPDGRRAAWLAWDHPRMPWDGTELLVADVGTDGTLGVPRTAAGGPQESIAQVDWSADGRLLYASDRSGWWNLYRDGEPLCPREEEFGGPLWKPGLRWFAPLAGGLVAVVHGRGSTALGVLDPETGEIVDAAGPWTEFEPTLAVHGEQVVAVGASPRSAHEVIELDICTGRARVIGAEHDDAVDPAYYPEPQIRTFTGPAGHEIHAHIYPPHNPGCVAPADKPPPFVVWAHGGPTGRAPLVLDLAIAYFTSRGIGIAEVNYGGSTGYGRA